MGRQGLVTARAVGDKALIAAAAAALCLCETVAGHIDVAHEHRAEALAALGRLSDAGTHPASRRSTTSRGRRPTWSAYDDGAHT